MLALPPRRYNEVELSDNNRLFLDPNSELLFWQPNMLPNILNFKIADSIAVSMPFMFPEAILIVADEGNK